MKRFKEKTVIVTGAGAGIGRAAAIRFAHEGANVVLIGRNAATLQETAQAFPQDRTWIHTDNYLTITCDISVHTQVQKMIKLVIDKFGKIDVLVNNIGEAIANNHTQVSAKELKTTMDIHINSSAYVCQAALPHLIDSKGNIVNVSSLTGIDGDWNLATYNAAKTDVNNLTRTLALNHSADGVRVNTVNATVIESNMTNNTQEVTSKNEAFLKGCLIRCFATPDDVAAAITFLASDEAAMMTGVHLPVDGGMSTLTE